jgi:hypothetical protein
MANVEDNLNAIIDVPFRSGGGGRRDKTVVSVVDGGEYINVYPGDSLCAVMRTWPLGAQVRCQLKNGKPDVLRFQAADSAGHTLRKKSKGGQREHFAVPTEVIGKLDSSIKGVEVESWADGDAICIRIGAFYANAGE